MTWIKFWQKISRVSFFFIGFFIISNGLKAQDSVSKTELYPVWHKEKWYFMDTCGDIPRKDYNPKKLYFADDEGIFISGNEKFGLINSYLDTLLPFQFDTIISYQGFIFARNKNEWTFINLRNKKEKIIQAEKIEIIDGLIYYFNNEKMGLIGWENLKDDFLITNEYDRIRQYGVNYLTYDSGKFGLLDKSGYEVLKPEFKEIQIDSYGIISYYDSYWKYILMGGRKVDPGIGNEVFFYSKFFWKIKLSNGKYSIYSLNSEKPVLQGHDNYFLLNDFFIAFRQNGKTGLANSSGDILIQPKFDFLGYITSDLFYYKKENLLGLTNSKGEILSEALFTDIEAGDRNFDNQLKINTNGKYGVMTRNGKILVPSEFNYVAVYDGGIVTYLNKLYGVYGENGKKLSDCIYNGHTVYSDPLNGNIVPSLRQFDLYKFWTDTYFDFYTKYEKLNSQPCNNYTLGNNTLKCYCDQGIEVVYLTDSGKVDSRMLYQDVPVIVVRDTFLKINKRIEISGRSAVLEEDQESGKFTMRFSKKKGFGFIPLSNQIYNTKYTGYYSGKVNLDTTYFNILSNHLSILRYDLSFSSTDGLLYTRDTLVATDFYKGTGGHSTSLDFMFTRDHEINFFTSSLPNKDILYMDLTQNYIQKLYVGGKMKQSSDMNVDFTLWDYFNRFNSNNNIWFSDNTSVKEIMDPHSRLTFEEGTWKVFHGSDDSYHENNKKRYFNGRQSFRYFEQSTFLYSHIYSMKKNKYGYIGRFGEVVLPEVFDTLYRINWEGGMDLIGNCPSEAKVFYNSNLNSLYNEFSNPGNFSGNLAIVKEGAFYGVIDKNEKLVIPCNSRKIEWIGKHFFKLLNGNGYLVYNRKGEKVISKEVEEVKILKDETLLFQLKGRIGIMDTLGNIKIENIYDSIVSLEDGGFYAWNSKQKDILSADWVKVRSLNENEKFKNGWFITKLSKKKFRLEKYGNKAIDFSTEMEPRVVNNIIRVKNKKGKYVFYDESGELIMNSNSGSIIKVAEDLTAIKDKSEWTLLNRNQSIVFSGIADEFIDFGMWIKVLVKDSSFIITREGKSVNLSDRVFPAKKSVEEKIICKHKSEFAFYDLNGNRISEFYESVRDFSEGYAAVLVDSQWGFIDKDGKIFIQPQFESVSDFSEGRFCANKKSRFGLFDQNGISKLPTVFTKIVSLENKLFLMTEESSGYYFPNKKMIWPSLY